MILNSNVHSIFSDWGKEFRNHIIDSINVSKQAKVVSYNSSKNTATVQILAKKKNSKGERYIISPILDVPVWFYNTGAFSLSCEIKEGTLGYLLFFDEGIDDYKYAGGYSSPDNVRMHSLNDCIFIPGFYPQTSVSGQCSDGINIGKNDGTSKIAIAANNDISIETNAAISIKSNLAKSVDLKNALSSFNISATGTTTITTPLASITLAINGDILAVNSTGCSVLLESLSQTVNVIAPRGFTVTTESCVFIVP